MKQKRCLICGGAMEEDIFDWWGCDKCGFAFAIETDIDDVGMDWKNPRYCLRRSNMTWMDGPWHEVPDGTLLVVAWDEA